MNPSTGPAVRGVIFDFGGVLAGTLSDLADRVGGAFGLTASTWRELVGLEPYETTEGNVWHAMEVGRATGDEWAAWFTERVRAATGVDAPADLVLQRMQASVSSLPPNDDVIERVRRAHAAGVATAICTNNADHLEWRHLVPIELFDAVIDSSEVGHRKPDPEIYLLTCERIGVAPSEAVMLDDFEANVEGARRVGLRAIHVGVDRGPALAELDRLLGHP